MGSLKSEVYLLSFVLGRIMFCSAVHGSRMLLTILNNEAIEIFDFQHSSALSDWQEPNSFSN